MSDIDWNRPYGLNDEPKPQETTVEDIQENPAVSKLREAFETARNAIIDGSKLAELVEELRMNVKALSAEVGSLQRDLEYVRNRNRELDEQVTEVRRQRDEAIADAAAQRQRVDEQTARAEYAEGEARTLKYGLEDSRRICESVRHERDDAELRALEAEDKLKAAEAKLAKIEEVFGVRDKPAEQPRTETGQFKPSYEAGSQGQY